jgi:GxxExxY protein
MAEEGKMLFQDVTERVIGCAIEVHRELGPGLLESVYQAALATEFFLRGVQFRQQWPLDVIYKGENIGKFKMDFLVEDSVVIELKSVERNDPVFEAQLLSYMKLGGYKVGLLINFNSVVLTKGLKRFVL